LLSVTTRSLAIFGMSFVRLASFVVVFLLLVVAVAARTFLGTVVSSPSFAGCDGLSLVVVVVISLLISSLVSFFSTDVEFRISGTTCFVSSIVVVVPLVYYSFIVVVVSLVSFTSPGMVTTVVVFVVTSSVVTITTGFTTGSSFLLVVVVSFGGGGGINNCSLFVSFGTVVGLFGMTVVVLLESPVAGS